MKTLITVTMIVTGLAFTSGVALASSCPILIKQGREAAAKLDAKDEKVKKALAKLDEAQKLHDAGKHSDSMAAAREGNAMLGVK